MNFIVFMICMIVAIFNGMLIDRLIIKSREKITDYEYRVMSFSSEEDAVDVLDILKERLDVNGGFIRVYDLYAITRTKSEDTRDFYYGWKSTNDFRIEETNNSWRLEVPEPLPIEKEDPKIFHSV